MTRVGHGVCAGILVTAGVLGAMPATHAQTYPASGNQGPANRHRASMSLVRTIDFESGADDVLVIAPSVGITTNSAEVIEGTRSLKLSGTNATFALRVERLQLEPHYAYLLEYQYRALAPGNIGPVGVWFVPGSSRQPGDVGYVPLGGPEKGALDGTDSRSLLLPDADGLFFFQAPDVPIVIDTLRIYRHDVQVFRSEPQLFTTGFPRLGNYSLLSPEGTSWFNEVSTAAVEELDARYDVMMGPSPDHTAWGTAWVSRLKRANPDLRILPYKQTFMAQFDQSSYGSTFGLNHMFNLGLRPEWFMPGPDGQPLVEPDFLQNVQLDHTPHSPAVGGQTVNQYTAEYLARGILGTGLWDGIHFDQPEWYINPLLGDPTPPIDLTRDGVADPIGFVQQAWQDGLFDFFRTASRRLGSAPLMFGNAGYIPGNLSVLPVLNGWEGEIISPYPILPNGDWETNEPSSWYRLLNNYRLAMLYARAPQMVALQFTGRDLGTQTGTPTPNGWPGRTATLEARDYRRMRLGLTTALLGNGFYEYDLVDNTTPPLWFDEFAVDSSGTATSGTAGKGYLGQPIGEAAELPYGSEVVFSLDFESADLPPGVVLGPGSISAQPGQVIDGRGSFVITQSSPEEGKWIFYSWLPLQAGQTYQLEADYRILVHAPTSYLGVMGLGFSDATGALTPGRSASLYLPDSGPAGQPGKLRAAVRVTQGGTVTYGGLLDSGTVALDNIRLVRGTGGVWRRDFEHGIVLVNPTPESQFVSQSQVVGMFNRLNIRRIRGSEAPQWNDGSIVANGLTIPPGDGIVLLADRLAPAALSGPTGINATFDGAVANLTWSAIPQYTAGYLVRYGESPSHLTRSVATGMIPHVALEDLTPGVTYHTEVAAYDFRGVPGPFSSGTFVTPGTAPASRPALTIGSDTRVAPGSVVTIGGADLADATAWADGAPYPATLAGAVVLVNGIEAALLSVGPNAVTFLTPWEIAGDTAIVTVVRGGIAAAERLVPVAAASPWLLTWGGTDFAMTGTDGPASLGGEVDLYAAGLGRVIPHPPNGSAPAGGASAMTPPAVTVGGVAAEVVSASLDAGSVALYRVRIRIPAALAPGFHYVQLSAGGEVSNAALVYVQ